jgi:alpha-1,4-N-acetylglucosaminyltransferase EXTL3
MTYARHNNVKDAIAMFKGVSQLHSVVLLWNDLEHVPDSIDLGLPQDDITDVLDAGVPLHVIRPERNSLNNRFVPYDAIVTDCVMQIDDDTRYLSKEMIIHGFR